MIGFWRAWGLVVGMMVGSGVYSLPSALAPYGLLSFWGWAIALLGALSLVGCFIQLTRSLPDAGAGGPAAYVLHTLGIWPARVVAWGYWISLVVAVAAIALSFVGYFSVFVPELALNSVLGPVAALLCIWGFVAISLRGTQFASSFQLLTSLLKIVPLVLIGLLGLFAGEVNLMTTSVPQSESVGSTLAVILALIMWSYIGIEAATIPADNVKQPRQTIPRAALIGTLSATAVYVLAMVGVMSVLPASELANSQAPVADAVAIVLGPSAGHWVALGALIAIGGTLNACVFLSGALPSVLASHGIFPRAMSQRKGTAYSAVSLCLAGTIASVLIVLNSAKGLVGAFELMIMISTYAALIAYLGAALAALKLTVQTSHWRMVNALQLGNALLALGFSLAAFVGAHSIF